MTKRTILFGPYPPPYGGVAVYVSQLNNHFAQLGLKYELKIACHDSGSCGNAVLPRFASVYRSFSSLSKNDVCLDSSSFFLEYIEYQAGQPFLAWLLLKLFRHFEWVKVIHDGTLPSRYSEFEFTKKILFHLSLKFVNEFIVVNDDLHHWLKDKLHVKQKVTVIKSLFPVPKSEMNVPLSDELATVLAKHQKWACSLGTFNSLYGFHHIADAVEAVRNETGADIGLLLIDGGFAVDISEQAINVVLKQRGWINVLRSIPHHEVLQLLRNMDVFVRGVTLESYGLSRVEALWCGTPVVATKTGETRGMLLYDFGNEKQLIHQIKEAIFSPSVKSEVPFWAEQYQKEAEKNLTDLICTITHNEVSF